MYGDKAQNILNGEKCVVLCFGPYLPSYTRNRIILKGLRKNNVDVIQCHDYSSPSTVLRFSKLAIKLVRKVRLNYNSLLILGFYGHILAPWAKFIQEKPVILDMFVGLHETLVIDRKYVGENSAVSEFYYLVDKYAPRVSDVILSDTTTHINYFSREFGLDETKFRRIFVGEDDDVFYPRLVRKQDNKFSLLFWGWFIPLQGIEHILECAKILENESDITFKIIGRGQTYHKMIRLSKHLSLKNVNFESPVPLEKLPNEIAKADVCLGIFGSSEKAKRVIPNKVYESLAMGKPLITSDSPAIREALTNDENCVLCERANPEAIADSILMLKEDEELRRKIALNGYDLFKRRFTPKAIGFELKKILMDLQ